jgi:serine/threonine protein kinase
MNARAQPRIADTEFEVPPTEYEGTGQNSAPRAALRALPSRLRDRYEIERELSARGSEADIFQVRALDGSGLRVVKLYRGDKSPKANVLQAVSESQSNHLLKIFEFGESDCHWYELLEFIEFGNLRGLLSQGAVSTERCTALLRQLAQALSDLHALNIFHRDVKPDNVLIKTKEPLHFVLSDYGIASETDGTSWETGWAGTAIYMAPEIAGGKRQLVSAACDYWALGMVLTEALTGGHPFKDLSITVAFHHLGTKPIDVSLVPLEWRRLCHGLLIRDPQKRWGKDQVQRWLAGERETIPLIEDVASAAVGHAYPFNGKEFDTLLELVGEFAKKDNWAKGSAEVRQGHLLDWLRKTSQYEAASFVEELREDKALNDDLRYF